MRLYGLLRREGGEGKYVSVCTACGKLGGQGAWKFLTLDLF